MDSSVITDIANAIGCGVDSIWSMAPTIASQKMLYNAILIVIGIVLLVLSIILAKRFYDGKFAQCNEDDDMASIVLLASLIVAVFGIGLIVCNLFSFIRWMVSPDVAYIHFLKDIVLAGK